MKSIQVRINNGQEKECDSGISISEVLKQLNPKTLKTAVAAEIDGQPVDLNTILDKDSSIRILSSKDPDGMEVFWHSSSHVMAQAVQALYPDAKLGIGPAIDGGFYYDFSLEHPLTVEDLPAIEEKMREIVEAAQTFSRNVLPREEAIEFFKKRGEEFKVELLSEFDDVSFSIYKNDTFADLCRGPHLPTTAYVKHFKLLSVAGAYWRGDERNAVLQRIYGVSFPKQSVLEAHLHKIEEAKKRDHRRLGKELDLFSFHAEGPGFPFWHPNGMILVNEVESYLAKTLIRHGYSEIKTPIILNEALWHRSGHWDNYKENMYFTAIDEQPYAVKPMNCPGSLLIYKNNMHSYRDLPIKMSELGLVHRHEKSGVLHGLFRVRQFTQDDAHVFCTPDQLENEIIQIIDLVAEVYAAFGFEEYSMELSTRPSKSIGSAEIWDMAETALKNALVKKGIDYELNEGEGAFYGPKIDYHIRDSIGRTWQCGTIQVDFSMPERFELEYVGQDGERHRPVMIHRAILGSVERFVGILIEHYGGAFPLWLAPEQCVIIPISEKHHETAQKINETLVLSGIRSQIDLRSEKVGYKIREAETRKIPYMCIIGDREVENKSVSLRKHKEGDLGSLTIDDVTQKLLDELHRRI